MQCVNVALETVDVKHIYKTQTIANNASSLPWNQNMEFPSARQRISRESMLMAVAQIVSLRGTCQRARVGAVLSRDGRILSVGYVGSPPGSAHCIDVGCQIENDGCIRTQHAEANAVAWAARSGVSTEGSTLFVTHSPCLSCAKVLIAAGVSKVYYAEPYRLAYGLSLLESSGVETVHLEESRHVV